MPGSSYYRKTFYLSAKADRDLIFLYSSIGSHSFINALKESLRSLIRPGYALQKERPRVLNMSENGHYSGQVVTFSLSEKKDGDIIFLLNKIKPRRLGLFLKTTLRSYFSDFCIRYCFEEDSLKINDISSPLVLLVGAPFQSSPSLIKSVPKERIKKTKPAAIPPVHEKPEIKEPQIFKEEPEEPLYTPVSASAPTDDTVNQDLSEDDILSLLENM